MPEWLPLMRDLGFPVAVAGFVLLRLEPRLRELTSALIELRLTLARCHSTARARSLSKDTRRAR